MSGMDPIVKRLRENRLNEEKINYAELDHEDLIRLAQQEDQAAFEELVRQYDPLISKQSKKFFLDGGSGDDEDIKQIATIGFWEAVTSYNPKVHKNGFAAYASLLMKRKLIDVLRKEDADVRKLNNLAGSTEDKISSDEEGGENTVGDTLTTNVSTEEEFLGRDGAKVIMQFMATSLSDTERDVIRKIIAGYKPSEIAEELDMKYKTVENAYMRVKNKLAEYMRGSKQESKKLSEAAESPAFTEDEKRVLISVLDKIDEAKSLRESRYSELSAAYAEKSQDELEQELEDIDTELEELVVEIKDRYYDDRDSLLAKLESLGDRINAMEEYLSPELYDKSQDILYKVWGAEDTEYTGPAVRRPDPYEEIGMSPEDFF